MLESYFRLMTKLKCYVLKTSGFEYEDNNHGLHKRCPVLAVHHAQLIKQKPCTDQL